MTGNRMTFCDLCVGGGFLKVSIIDRRLDRSSGLAVLLKKESGGHGLFMHRNPNGRRKVAILLI